MSDDARMSDHTFGRNLAPYDVNEIAKVQQALVLPRFNAEDIWNLGNILRNMLLNEGKPVVISICLANTSQIVFQAVTRSGTSPDNSIWIARKVKTVLRFGVPSYSMHVKFKGDELAFAAKYGLSPNDASTYAIHGGAVPIMVKGVEGIVAVATVSGLSQDMDHRYAASALVALKEEMVKGV